MRRAALAIWLGLVAGSAGAEVRLSIDITTSPAVPFETALSDVQAAGANATSLTVFWDDLEKDGAYAPEFDWPAIANQVYPAAGMGVNLTISVIDTVADRRPDNLRAKAWDDPEVIRRFHHFLNQILGRMTDTDILSLAIGNEVDGFLAAPEDVAVYSRFVAAAATHVKTRGVPVGTKLTFGALKNPDLWAPILKASDAVFLTYYPLDSAFQVRPTAEIAQDLDAMVAFAGAKPIYLLESGYPSHGCKATPEAQKAFAETLLAEATKRPSIELVSLTWLTDLSQGEIEAYRGYYGVPDRCFAAFLATLGLKSEDGTDKPVLTWLKSRP